MPKYIEMEGELTIDLTAIFEQIRKPKSKEEDKPTKEKDEKCQTTS